MSETQLFVKKKGRIIRKYALCCVWRRYVKDSNALHTMYTLYIIYIIMYVYCACKVTVAW